MILLGNWLYTKEDTFIINSAYDLWSGLCILLSGPKPQYENCNTFEDWYSCSFDTTKCNSEQVKTMNKFEVRS